MRKTMMIVALLIASMLLAVACTAEPVEVTRVVEVEVQAEPELIEVTRVVAGETITEQIEVTRVVEVEVEVPVEAEGLEEEVAETSTLLNTDVSGER